MLSLMLIIRRRRELTVVILNASAVNYAVVKQRIAVAPQSGSDYNVTGRFIEGDLDAYVKENSTTLCMGRRGEPELLLASHVLKIDNTIAYDLSSASISWASS
ncbi:hypothetical protein NC651_019470 [Populus alba x Populus x berolinensis]|nr:hypothetical protein NC651_019470 [Populus alba x Populus x berolinensis]